MCGLGFAELADMQEFFLDTVDSTNEFAQRLVHQRRIERTAFVVAREQTGGKGTRGRHWLSPRDAGVYLSVIHFSPSAALPTTTLYAKSAAVACVEALAQFAGIQAEIKPVNDLIFDGRKLGGILIETEVTAGRTTAVITGVGINVRIAERRLPAEAPSPVTLEEIIPSERFGAFSSDAFVRALVQRINECHAEIIAGRPDRIEASYRRWTTAGRSLPTPGGGR
jgi:biotin-[acetyl-CoA-carboxylase] ligase BirA-like protein